MPLLGGALDGAIIGAIIGAVVGGIFALVKALSRRKQGPAHPTYQGQGQGQPQQQDMWSLHRTPPPPASPAQDAKPVEPPRGGV